MPARRILQLGDPMLRAVSVAAGNRARSAEILLDLRDTLHEFQRTHGFGRGISAVQIGVCERIIYMEIGGKSYSVIDPEFEYKSGGMFRLWDDCFSFPNLLVWLERHETVRLRYTDQHGAPQLIEATGPFSELIQHEMDHLDGILAIDRALDRNSLCTREEWERRYAPAAVAQHT